MKSFDEYRELNEGKENDSSKTKAMKALVEALRTWGDKYTMTTRKFVWEHLTTKRGEELMGKILRNPKTYFPDSEFIKLVEKK
jgi:hypothetical protein